MTPRNSIIAAAAGSVAAEQRGAVPLGETRVLMPMTVLMLVHCIVSIALAMLVPPLRTP